MKKSLFYTFASVFILLISELSMGQYFPNSSFEGPAPMENTPPPGWAKCDGSPDTQPMAWDVDKLPSEGVSFVGMCWFGSYEEMISTELTQPFLQDSCYLFEIDLSFYPEINYNGQIEINYPITIQIYGAENPCGMNALLWESPYVEHLNWQAYSFEVQPDFDIETISIRTNSAPNPLPYPEYIGYILMDNIQITTPPPFELGPDTTICSDTIFLCLEGDFENIVWQDGSSDTCFAVTEPGIYWVDANHIGFSCLVSDTVVVEGGIEFELPYDSTLMFCDGDSLILNAGEGFEEYLWSTGEEDTAIVIYSPGIYWVEVLNAEGCEGMDTVYVENYPPSETSLGPDTVICENGILTLDAGVGFLSYLWHDDSGEQTCIVEDTGVYWVSVMDENGCLATDTIHVDLSPAIFVSLGNDTTICEGVDFNISPGNGFEEYYWQNGSSESFHVIVDPGIYWVQVVDVNGCTGSDTVLVSISPSPEINLGPDTTICEGESLSLELGNSYASYLWQDNSTSSSFYVYESGLYSVTVTNYFDCAASDDIVVDVGSPEISLGPDSSVCYHDSIYLKPGDNFAFYQWHDGSNGSSYHVTSSGIYSVFVSDEFGCSDEDEVELIIVWPPEVDLGEDQEMCSGNSITLEAPVGPYTYYWNGVEGTATYQVTTGGECTVQLVNMCGDAIDDVYIEEIPTPNIELGEDILLNPGESIELDAGVGFDTYLWQDGSENQFYLVSSDNANPQNPNYYVEVSNGPCLGSDTVEVFVFMVELPAVFTPNNDGDNDLFLPMDNTWNGISNHHISIFNRWGEKVWESENFEDGWDGKKDGSIVADGTYFWVLEVYYGPDNIKQTLKGNISVLGGNN